jgi:hypothetical protein
LYFEQVEHDRFGTIRQQIWAMLHYPLHVAILLTVEGSTHFITWWIAVENLQYLDGRLALDLQHYAQNSTLFRDALTRTLSSFDLGFIKESIPDFTYNLTQIQNLDMTIAEDFQQIMTIEGDIYASLIIWLFTVFGFKLSDDLTMNAKDNGGKALAVFRAYGTVFVFFLVSSGSVLFILGIMCWFGKNHKTSGEIVSGFVRVLAGIGLALVSTCYYTTVIGSLISSPLMIPLAVMVYLLCTSLHIPCSKCSC